MHIGLAIGIPGLESAYHFFIKGFLEGAGVFIGVEINITKINSKNDFSFKQCHAILVFEKLDFRSSLKKERSYCKTSKIALYQHKDLWEGLRATYGMSEGNLEYGTRWHDHL